MVGEDYHPASMANILVLGAGMMGTALTLPLLDRRHDVRLVGTHLDREIVDSLQANRVHPKLRVDLPDALRPFHLEALDEAAEGADAIVLGVSSAGIPWAVETIAPWVRPGQLLFMITKGLVFRHGRVLTLPEVVREGLPEAVRATIHPAAIAGPCIAGELARRVPSVVVLAGADPDALGRIAKLARTPYYHLRPTTDVMGAELSAALKNAYAMGIAFATGMHEARGGAPGSVAMHNLESAVFAQAIVEMTSLVTVLGGKPATVAGLAGVGDLDVTTNGGRTGRFGKLLGSGLRRDEAIARMEGATLECLEILTVMREVVADLDRRGVLRAQDLPLLVHMIEVALDGAEVALPLERFFASEVAPEDDDREAWT
jgi:glycerol-3-phosphate dehydrogenase (NAD(P)+)